MARTLYEKFRDLWKDKPDKTTPVTAEALNHFEQGIYDNSQNMALKEIYDDEAISMGRKRDTNIGNHSYAVGYEVVASESDSHAEGYETKATGPYAHAEGFNTIASGAESHAEGFYTQAVGDASHAEGCYTQAMRDYQHVQGKFNEPDKSYAHIVGGGTSDNDRKNIHTLDWEGNARFAGNVSSNRYNLNDLGDAINKLSDTGDEDISSQCYAYASGQRLEITIPIDGIFVNGNFIAGAFFFGIVNTNLPPMLFNANILAIKYSDNHTQIEGRAESVNTIQSCWEQFGRVFEGSIQLSQLTQNSATTCIGTVQITFDLGFDLTTANLTLFKSNKYYYPIARVWNDLTERIEALEQRIAELESAE